MCLAWTPIQEVLSECLLEEEIIDDKAVCANPTIWSGVFLLIETAYTV